MRYIDMHTHTTASDGTFTPKEIIDYAIHKELAGIAITDHDTVDGVIQALDHAEGYKSFIVIAGIELSTEYLGEEIHILGYNIDYKYKKMLKKLTLIQNERVNRGMKIIQKLQHLDIMISYDEVLEISREGVMGRPHIAKVLVNKGYVKNIEMAFNKYLNKGCPAYVARYKLTPFEAIDLIKEANGFTTIAHPGLIKNETILKNILTKGVDGVEVYHPEHNSRDRNRFLSLAKKHNLFITGGSDFHSPPLQEGRHGDLGSEKISVEIVSKFLKI
ncbi:PHP domain-containing protein [Natronincola ferrireducens]|uniref:Polymerase/histidinol phosphatase N-terminal domain-containing protein n=1 Tax=Natronincola ferrireducens TaxID=393762 RepID=A0A1G9C8B6_9FIRM|nr:PHP domain-containing protein [Natronincola ferrireducens]SDK47853.1 hypothetical protein SAMN05660472_01393 [Natronincola ferrireducens]